MYEFGIHLTWEQVADRLLAAAAQRSGVRPDQDALARLKTLAAELHPSNNFDENWYQTLINDATWRWGGERKEIPGMLADIASRSVRFFPNSPESAFAAMHQQVRDLGLGSVPEYLIRQALREAEAKAKAKAEANEGQ
jgi:hypothetical protein